MYKTSIWSTRFTLFLILFSLWRLDPSLAQDATGKIEGTLKDPQGAVVPNASVTVTRNGEFLKVLKPESRIYTASRQPTHEVALRTRLNEDLYLNFAGMNGDRAVIQSYIFPLVSWIWIGALTLVFGTLVALVPSKVKREYARTQVVGITRKHATVEK